MNDQTNDELLMPRRPGLHSTLIVPARGVLLTLCAGLFADELLAAPPPILFHIVEPRTQIPAVQAVPRPGLPLVGWSYSYAGNRQFAHGDFNADGLADLILAPQVIQTPVEYFPVEVWLNNGAHGFRKATEEVIAGAIPRPLSVNGIFVRDFNEDGRPDAMFMDSGKEFPDAPEDSGGIITLLLSRPDGKLEDATANIADNPKVFHHGEGIGDFNGDGHLDVIDHRWETPSLDYQGIGLLLGDGEGKFTAAHDRLPPEIRFQPRTTFLPDRQYTAAAALGDLDGDGRDDVISASGAWDTPTPRSVRFFKSLASGVAEYRSRVGVPAALAGIGENADTIGEDPRGAGLYPTQMVPGDYDLDGRLDLLLFWEGVGKSFVQLLHNDGDFQFTDITLDAFGSYDMGWTAPGDTRPSLLTKFRVLDFNGDGALDVMAPAIGRIEVLLRHTVWLNDGTGRFEPLVPATTDGPIGDSDISLNLTMYNDTIVMPTARGGAPSILFKDVLSDVWIGPPDQTRTITLTVLAPDPPTLGIDDVSIAEGADGRRLARFAVRLSHAAVDPVSFDIATLAGSALPGSDFVGRKQRQTIAAGTAVKTFAVEVIGDAAVEPNESFKVRLSKPAGAAIFDAEATGRILNDDGPTLSVADVPVLEGAAGTTRVARFVITLSRPVATEVSYRVATVPGTASAGTDFTAVNVVQKIPPGQTSRIFSVTIRGDDEQEANENFTVRLSEGTAATLLRAQAQGTIRNDDSG